MLTIAFAQRQLIHLWSAGGGHGNLGPLRARGLFNWLVLIDAVFMFKCWWSMFMTREGYRWSPFLEKIVRGKFASPHLWDDLVNPSVLLIGAGSADMIPGSPSMVP